MEEIWIDISGYEGKYQVSNLGRVRSLIYKNNANGKIYKREKLLKQFYDRNGYLRVDLKMGKRKNAQVHRLVALAFIPNPLEKPQVNHKDKDKENNKVDNLEWVTNQENQLHRYRIPKTITVATLLSS